MWITPASQVLFYYCGFDAELQQRKISVPVAIGKSIEEHLLSRPKFAISVSSKTDHEFISINHTETESSYQYRTVLKEAGGFKGMPTYFTGGQQNT